MRAPLQTLFNAFTGFVAATVLAACATIKDEPAPQVPTELPPPSLTAPTAPDVTPPPTPSTAPPIVDNFSDLPPDRVYFEYDKADLSPEGLDALQKQAAWLQNHPMVTLVVEGHSDERGTREYNLALAARRATAVRIFL